MCFLQGPWPIDIGCETLTLNTSVPKKDLFLSNLKFSVTNGHSQLLAYLPRKQEEIDFIPLNAVYSQHHLGPRHYTGAYKDAREKEQMPCTSFSLRLCP